MSAWPLKSENTYSLAPVSEGPIELALGAGLLRFHFCRAFKDRTELSPLAWLRQHQLKPTVTMLRETNDSVVTTAAAPGYSPQPAFGSSFKS